MILSLCAGVIDGGATAWWPRRRAWHPRTRVTEIVLARVGTIGLVRADHGGIQGMRPLRAPKVGRAQFVQLMSKYIYVTVESLFSFLYYVSLIFFGNHFFEVALQPA